MNFDRQLFADKLKRYCEQLFVSMDELSSATGIRSERLQQLTALTSDPTGDEILIFSDYFKCDFKFFISNERHASFEQAELIYRRYGGDLTKSDRWAIQEFLYLCECEELLFEELSLKTKKYKFTKIGSSYKVHGKQAALDLRSFLGYANNQIAKDIYDDIRRLGIHVFRRRLFNSQISGFYVNHPVAGASILINHNEDVYRQRFSAAHELAHAILDADKDFVVSYSRFNRDDLVEIRANNFASAYLLPQELLESLPKNIKITSEVACELASRLMVNITTLLISLKEYGIIDKNEYAVLNNMKRKVAHKIEPEISSSFSRNSKERSELLLNKGLSSFYVELCLDAFEKEVITFGRLCEMLLMNRGEVVEILKSFKRIA